MARTVKDAKLETPSARTKLAPRHEPYWKSIDGGMHIGYRKGKLRVSWLASEKIKEKENFEQRMKTLLEDHLKLWIHRNANEEFATQAAGITHSILSSSGKNFSYEEFTKVVNIFILYWNIANRLPNPGMSKE